MVVQQKELAAIVEAARVSTTQIAAVAGVSESRVRAIIHCHHRARSKTMEWILEAIALAAQKYSASRAQVEG